MLTIPQALLDRIHAHGEETFPNDRYEITAEDRQAAETLAREQGWQVVGFYHSHPDHDAYFSRTDLEHSEEYAWGEPWVPPTYSYLVTSIHGGKHSHWKAFVVVDGESVEEPVTVS